MKPRLSKRLKAMHSLLWSMHKTDHLAGLVTRPHQVELNTITPLITEVQYFHKLRSKLFGCHGLPLQAHCVAITSDRFPLTLGFYHPIIP